MDSDPHPLEFPGSQVMIDALPLGEIGWQHAPLDPTFGHRQDGIEHCPHTQGARSSTAFGGGDHLFDPLPCLVGQVAWIYFFVHRPILHNPRRLFRQALRDTFTLLKMALVAASQIARAMSNFNPSDSPCVVSPFIS